MGFYLDSGGLVDDNDVRVVRARSGNLSVYTNNTLLSPNTKHKIAEFNALDTAAYAVAVYWPGGYTSGGTNIHWETSCCGVVGIASASSYYNANPYQEITMAFTHHHRTAGNPTFWFDSDNSAGNYGKLSLFMELPQEEKFTYINVWAQRLIAY
jgi:hypothetical protein